MIVSAKPSGNLLGYVRVSTNRQDEAMQHEALDRVGVLKRNRYADHGVSGAMASRPGLTDLLSDAEPGDTIVVYKLDRLGRSTAHVASLIEDLTTKDIAVRSIADGLDSTTPTGKAMLQMLAIFSEMERTFISERTVAGLSAARARGRVGGRPKVTDSAMARKAQTLRTSGESVAEIARTLGVSVATIYRVTRASV